MNSSRVLSGFLSKVCPSNFYIAIVGTDKLLAIAFGSLRSFSLFGDFRCFCCKSGMTFVGRDEAGTSETGESVLACYELRVRDL